MFLKEMFDLMDERYSAKDDESIIRFDDIRKTKLTLEQINQIRKEQEIKAQEYNTELETVQKMYAAPKEEAAPTI
jgi:CHASE3 domain sensor protein|tara:strand:- start:15 stop:239 length:225 start_codon:yes stop_codon:yes gene_type:complete